MIDSRLLTIAVFLLFCAFTASSGAAASETGLADSELMESLRADYAVLVDASAEFEQIGGNDSQKSAVSRQEQADYAAWIRQLAMQFAESCQMVSLRDSIEIPADIPCAEFAAGYIDSAGIDIQQEHTDAEKTALMVGSLEGSLGEFDEKLLREDERVKTSKPRTAATNSGGGGGQSGGSGGQAGDEGQDNQSGSESSQNGQQSGRTNNDQNRTGAPGSPRGGRQNDTPDDVPDGSNDDVIARQLREAAEKETDPELRKKLWEEYKRYKSG